MVLSWLARSRRTASVDDLVARRRYGKAVEALREEFGDRQPTAAERLRLADLLVLADRASDALPILLGVADELTRFGFAEKALEALRRASEVEPGRPDVGRRIAALRRKAKTASAAEPAPDAKAAPDWGAALDQAFAGAPPAGTNGSGAEAQGGTASPELPAAAPAPHEAAPPVRVGKVTVLAGGGPSAEDDYLPESELEPEPASAHAGGEVAQSERHPIEAVGDDTPELELTEDGLEDEAGPRDPADKELHEFLLALGRTSGPDRRGLGATLFAGFPQEEVRSVRRGLTPHVFAPGDVVVGEGEPGDSLFLIASGSVRILILGGHGLPFDIRRLDAGDFFGEVAVLSGGPRTATVVAATPCQALEIHRTALESLLRLRPAARALMQEVCANRASCQEEEAIRSLPPEAAHPEHAAAALQAHFGSSDWSPRVRTYLARLLLDAGRQDEALAVLAGAAQDLARRGHAQKAIALLKKVERVQRHGVQEVELAPLRPGRRRSARHARPGTEASGAPGSVASRAATGAAFREWVGLLIRAADELAVRSAPSGPVEEVAERGGQGQGRQLAG